MAIQRLNRQLRAFLTQGLYHDYDMKSAHPTFVRHLCEGKAYCETTYQDKYLNDRTRLLKEGNTAKHTMKQPAKIDGELLRLRARKQHAEIQRMKKAAFTDPFQLVDKKPVHHRDLAGRPTETEKADLQPDQNSLGEADASGARPVPI